MGIGSTKGGGIALTNSHPSLPKAFKASAYVCACNRCPFATKTCAPFSLVTDTHMYSHFCIGMLPNVMGREGIFASCQAEMSRRRSLSVRALWYGPGLGRRTLDNTLNYLQ